MENSIGNTGLSGKLGQMRKHFNHIAFEHLIAVKVQTHLQNSFIAEFYSSINKAGNRMPREC
jgi:hypothetical protein